MTYDFAFTVFTPTYNRAEVLDRVYRSLAEQTFRDFEWLVVDDGSTDDTRDRVETWEEEADFPVRYRYQENQGLHVATNRAVETARGRLFLKLDSDDACLPTALERLHRYWEKIPDDERDRFSGVACLCQDETGRIIGDRFPEDVFDSDPLEKRYRYRVSGQKWGFHRTDVLKEFPFDETEVMGSNPWRRIARKYKVRYVNEPLKIYHQDDPQSSLSRGTAVTRPRTAFVRNRETLNEEIDWFPEWPSEFLRAAALYSRYGFHVDRGPVQQLRELSNPLAKLLWVVAAPAGYGIYRRDLRTGRA